MTQAYLCRHCSSQENCPFKERAIRGEETCPKYDDLLEDARIEKISENEEYTDDD